MSLSLQLELSDKDIEHLTAAIAKAKTAAIGKSEQEVTAAARVLLSDANDAKVPDFIATRLGKLDAMIAMLADEAWSLPQADRERVVSAMAYFSECNDLIPDSIPVFGYFDDAVVIELSAIELQHELSAYGEFCEFRQEQAVERGLTPETVGRTEWLDIRRDELQARMHRRRNLEQGGGYGSSSGYSGGKSYSNNAWRPGLLRVR